MADYITIISSVLSSMGLSAAAAGWLAKQLVDHRLEKDLKEHQAHLDQNLKDYQGSIDQNLKAYQARLDQNLKDYQLKIDKQIRDYDDLLGRKRDQHQASLRQQVESALGNEAAERQYVFDARKRLYTAIGPLRFQLLLACRQVGHRVEGHGKRPYVVDMQAYYGRNTLYRILRPLAISDLIERQIAYADFSVDHSAVRLLRFRKAASLALSGDEVVRDHPKVNWERQEEHVMSDRLAAVADALVHSPQPENDTVLRFGEFELSFTDPAFVDRLSPFPQMLNEFNPVKKPILWLRLICFGYICNEFIRSEGEAVGFEVRDFPVRELLRKAQDPHIEKSLEEYERAIREVSATRL